MVPSEKREQFLCYWNTQDMQSPCWTPANGSSHSCTYFNTTN